jgi:fido (protein-threonine AMPylation protein)
MLEGKVYVHNCEHPFVRGHGRTTRVANPSVLGENVSMLLVAQFQWNSMSQVPGSFEEPDRRGMRLRSMMNLLRGLDPKPIEFA